MLPVLAWILGIALLGVLLGMIFQLWGTRRDRKVHPPPGRLIDIGTHRLHLYETGSGQGGPTIVLESGLMSTNLSWTELQRDLEQSFRVVSYDRAGLGWSDLGPMPRTAERIVEELHQLLEKANIPTPYVLVGHSFGGLTMQLFAARYPQTVAGMVLVDAVAPVEWNPPSEQDRKLSGIGAKVCRRSAVLARLGILRFVAWLIHSGLKDMASPLVRLISRGTPADSGSVSSPWFFALPPKERAMAAIFWIQPKFALTISSQLENLPVSAAQTGQHERFCEKRVVILTASTSSLRRRNGHIEMARRLPLGEHIFASESNHWIMQGDREMVIRAIQSIVENRQDTGGAGLAYEKHSNS